MTYTSTVENGKAKVQINTETLEIGEYKLITQYPQNNYQEATTNNDGKLTVHDGLVIEPYKYYKGYIDLSENKYKPVNPLFPLEYEPPYDLSQDYGDGDEIIYLSLPQNEYETFKTLYYEWGQVLPEGGIGLEEDKIMYDLYSMNIDNCIVTLSYVPGMSIDPVITESFYGEKNPPYEWELQE